MITIIVATHGSLANGFIDAANLIIGEQENLFALGLNHDDSIEAYTDGMCQITKETANQVLILTDLLGASPYNAAARAISTSKNKQLVCISGLNLPILIEALLKRNDMPLIELCDYLINIGKEGITQLAMN